MAQRVLGRSRYKNAPYYHLGVHRIASHTTGRRYRAACRRAERYAGLLHTGRHIAFIWAMFRQSLWPLRHLLDLMLYAFAGAGVLLRDWRSNGNERVYEKEEDIRQIAWKMAQKKNHLRLTTAVGFLCIGVFFFTLSTYGIGLEVILDGESIGFVANQGVFENSLDNVSARATEILDYTYTVRPDARFRFALVKRDRIFNSAEVEHSLLSAIPEIENLYVLRVEGNIIGAARNAGVLQNTLNKILADYPLPEGAKNVSFVQDYSIDRQLTSLRHLRDGDSLYAALTGAVRDEVRHTVKEGETSQSIAESHGIALESLYTNNPQLRESDAAAGQNLLIQRKKAPLSIQYTVMHTTEETLPYPTEYIAKHSLWEGESELITKGQDGVNLIIERQVFVDGYPPETELIGSYVGKAPTPEIVVEGSRSRDATGEFIRPFGGSVSSPYGTRSLFGAVKMHAGTDFRGNVGEIIVASDGGVVIHSGQRSSFGLLVVIDHQNGYQTYYAHCSELLVSVGQIVGQGEAISKIGNTGRSTGPHLHFEIHYKGITKDPMKIIKTD